MLDYGDAIPILMVFTGALLDRECFALLSDATTPFKMIGKVVALFFAGYMFDVTEATGSPSLCSCCSMYSGLFFSLIEDEF